MCFHCCGEKLRLDVMELSTYIDKSVYYCLQAIGRVSYNNTSRSEKYIFRGKVG